MTVPAALSAVLPRLRCPVCAGGLDPAGRAVVCPGGHVVDVARQGYLNLVGGRPHRGDTADMVAARVAFLQAGHYRPIAAALAERAAARSPEPRFVVDAGGGTGYYLAAVLDRLAGADGACLDSSSAALRRAARAHPRAAAVGADIWQSLPLTDSSTDLVLSVFAPRNVAEVLRILRPGGVWLVVTPRPDHLVELVTALGLLTVDPHKEERLATDLAAFTSQDSTQLTYRVLLEREDVRSLVLMGPSAHHVAAGELTGRLADLPEPMAVTVSLRLATYRAGRP